MTNQNQQQNELMAEIFIKPSSEIKTDRFSSEAQAANCSGSCESGICKAIVL